MLESAPMPLPVTEVERELLHTRRVRYEGYKRADGLWDIEAHLTDVKNHDYHLKTGVRRAGQPVHEHVAAHHHRPQASPSSMPPLRPTRCPIRAAARRSPPRTGSSSA